MVCVCEYVLDHTSERFITFIDNLHIHTKVHKVCLKLKLNFVYFKTIHKQVLQRISISFVGTDASARGSLVWEEARVPGEDPHVQAGDCHNFSHTTTVDQGDRTRVTR